MVKCLDESLTKRYKPYLKDAFDYIEKKKPVGKRKQWTPSKREKWMVRHKECPICSEKWSKSIEMTKEHIQPLVLGGQESDDNVIPLCKKCNNARNYVMTAILGSTSILAIRNRMPAIKTSIEEFVIWCHATISGDSEALNHTRHLTKSFCEKRGISNPFTKKMTSFSVREQAEKTRVSWMKRTFGNARKILPKRSRKSDEEAIEGTRIDCKNKRCNYTLVIPYNFQGKYRCPDCKQEHSTQVKTKSNKTIHVSEQNHLPESASKEMTLEKYPVTKYLNSGAAGLKFPREPKHFVELVVWFVENVMKFETLQECISALRETDMIPKSRVRNNLLRITHGITGGGGFDTIKQEDLEKGMLYILNKTLENLLLNGIEIESIENKDEFIERLKDYFSTCEKLAPQPDSNYPSTSFLNTARGLRLPQEPNQLANLIQFFVKEYPKFQNFSDCIEIMTKSNHLSDIGKPRIKNCVIHILRSISLNEDFDVVFSTESDFTTKDISDKLFASFDVNNLTYVKDKVKFAQRLYHYFVEVNKSLN